jgi:hypothetical protein
MKHMANRVCSSEISVTRSQESATLPQPEFDASRLHTHTTSLIPILILSSHLYLGLQSGLLPSDFLTEILSFSHALFPTYVTFSNLLDFYSGMLLAHNLTPKLEGHLSLALYDYLFSMYTAYV